MQTKNAPTLRFKDDSGQEFPAWKICKLGDITEKYTEKNCDGKPYPVCSISNTQGFVSQKEMFKDSRLERLDKSAHKLVKPRQFAYNPARINVGSIAFQDREETVIVSPLYEVIQTNEKVHPLWLRYFFATQAFAYGVWKRGEGSVRICLSYDRFAKIRLHLPSLPEQQKIANLFSALDKSISIQKRKVSALADIKKGMLQKIFSQELRFKDENGGEFPAWEEKKLGNILREVSELTDLKTGIPLFSLTVEDGLTRKTERYNRDFLTKKNDFYKIVHPNQIVYNPMNITLGAISYNKSSESVAVSGYYTTMVTKQGYDEQFLFTWMKTNEALHLFYKCATGTLLEKQRVQFSKLCSIKTLIPSLPEQQKIAAYFSHLDNLLHVAREKLIRLQECKKGMLQKMFI